MHPVSMRNVTRHYRLGSVKVTALRNVSLDLPAMAFAVIAGPSGSGKTTLLNLVGCIDRADSGELTIAGEAVRAMSDDALADFRARHIGFVFQHFNLLPVLSVEENVEYPLLLAKVPTQERRTRVGELVDAVGLAKRRHYRPGQLSGGERQRVAIARALATRPRLLVADEPTANLDSHTGQEIIALLRRMQREHGIACLLSSHDPQVHAAADDVFFLRDGGIVGTGHRAEAAGPGARQ